jgi:hypothetical protein
LHSTHHVERLRTSFVDFARHAPFAGHTFQQKLEPVTDDADARPITAAELGPVARPDPIATFDAIRQLDRHLAATTDPKARVVLRNAIRFLEADLLVQFSGTHGDRRHGTRRVSTDRRDSPPHEDA